MGEEEYQMITTKFSQQEDKDNSNRVSEWEDGLPSGDDLPPLSQSLISPELASAFSITPEPCKTYMDVNRASQITLSNLRKPLNLNSTTNIKQLPSFNLRRRDVVDVVKENEEEGGAGESQSGGSDDVRKVRRVEDTVEVYSAMEKDKENSNEPQQQNEAAAAAAAAAKRARLVWTPQLHKRFVDAVSHLGIKSAVPKTIMQLMNVEGLTRENVASHLQKYRLYLKRMQGLSNEGPAPSDQLFASTPVPQSFREAVGGGGGGNVASVPMPYGVAMLPFMSMGHGHGGMVPGMVPYHGLDPNQSNVLREQQKDWSGSKFGSIMSQQHVNSHHKGRLSNHS